MLKMELFNLHVVGYAEGVIKIISLMLAKKENVPQTALPLLQQLNHAGQLGKWCKS